MNEDKLPAELTLQAAAKLLGVSTDHLVRLLDNGTLSYQGVGRNRRIRAEDVLALQQEDRARREATRQLTEETQKLGLDY